MDSYWTTALRERISRRRGLAAAGAGVLGGALLAACGGSDSGSEGKSTGLITPSTDTTKQAKPGGTFKGLIGSDIQTLEPGFRSQPTGPFNIRAYQGLLANKPGYFKLPTEYIGDAAESWEFSPDFLTLTMKLHTEGKWDQRAPTNGRNLDANDVAFSWTRFAATGSSRVDYANSVNPSAPIVSMTAPDAKTIVIKLKEPRAGILGLLNRQGANSFWVIPKEADGGFDIRREQRGSGPYVLTENVTSSRYVFEKNENYWNKGQIMIQRLEYPVITEYAQQLAQLKTGAVYHFPMAGSGGVRSDDILRTKSEAPELNLYRGLAIGGGARWFFGWEDTLRAPFKDVRLRQAFSMATDRDLYIDTFANVPAFEAAGIDMERRWNSAVTPGAEGWWLDPQGKDFGPNAKYYQYNIAEAKKLVAAAGFPDGVDAEAHYITTTEYGAEFPKQVEVILGMVREAGLRLKTVPADFNTDWQQKYRDVKGNFDGLAVSNNPGIGDTGDTLYSFFNSNGSNFRGFDGAGKSSFKGDPTMEDLTNRMKVEFDEKKRYALANELQRYEALMQFIPYMPGGSNSLTLLWPAVENWDVHMDTATFIEEWLWINDQKAPLKRA